MEWGRRAEERREKRGGGGGEELEKSKIENRISIIFMIF